LALLTGLTIAVAVALTAAVFIVPTVLLFNAGHPLIGALFGVLAFGVALLGWIALTVYVSVAPPALLLEDLGPLRALRRSARLVRGGFWRTLLILGVAYLLVTIGSSIILVP